MPTTGAQQTAVIATEQAEHGRNTNGIRWVFFFFLRRELKTVKNRKWKIIKKNKPNINESRWRSRPRFFQPCNPSWILGLRTVCKRSVKYYCTQSVVVRRTVRGEKISFDHHRSYLSRHSRRVRSLPSRHPRTERVSVRVRAHQRPPGPAARDAAGGAIDSSPVGATEAIRALSHAETRPTHTHANQQRASQKKRGVHRPPTCRRRCGSTASDEQQRKWQHRCSVGNGALRRRRCRRLCPQCEYLFHSKLPIGRRLCW